MAGNGDLGSFVREALSSGHSQAEIAGALKDAGWDDSEIKNALADWSDTEFPIPVPRPRATLTAGEFFYFGLMYSAMITVCFSLTLLLFDLIDLWLPDIERGTGYEVYTTRNIRWWTALLVVFAPLLWFMNTRIAAFTRRNLSKRKSPVRLWLGQVTLYLAIFALLIDLAYVLYTFLNGEMTLRFFAKSLVVALVTGGVFLYFRAETHNGKDAV